MKTKIAEELYHGKEGYNCAQAILKTFQQEFKVAESTIIEASEKGRGRAEGGKCGALYAALELAKTKEQQHKLNYAFMTNGASLSCKEIRKARKMTCKECVRLAAKEIQNIL